MRTRVFEGLVAAAVVATGAGHGWVRNRRSPSPLLRSATDGALFGVRGGANPEAKSEATAAGTDVTIYPALTDEEVTEKLNRIPVFGVTDQEGNAIVITGEDGVKVVCLYMVPETAHALLQLVQAKAPPTAQLQVMTMPLGVFWPRLTRNPAIPGNAGAAAAAAKVRTPDGDATMSDVQIRLFADGRDLALARNITTQQLMIAANTTDESALAGDPVAKEKLSLLNASWGVVPVFTMEYMQIQRNGSSVRPWFVSLMHCVNAWKSAVGDKFDETSAGQGLHMTTVEELVNAMTKPSRADFRAMEFVPSQESQEYLMAKLKQAQAGKAAGGMGDGLPGLGEQSDEDGGEDDGGLFG